MEVSPYNNYLEADRYQKAVIIDNRIKSGMLDVYMNMAIMVDEKLYKELGCATMNEYAAKLEMDRRTAYEYALIGRGLNQLQHSGESVETARHLLGMGTSKLADIVRHAREQLPRLVESGEIEINDEVYTVEQIEQTSRKELREQLKLVKEARQEAAALKSEVRIKTLENEQLAAELEDARRNRARVEEEKEVHECITRAASKLHDSLAEFQKLPSSNDLSDANKVEIVTQLNAAYDSILFLREKHVSLIEEFIAKS